jgi:hypothetical protein
MGMVGLRRAGGGGGERNLESGTVSPDVKYPECKTYQIYRKPRLRLCGFIPTVSLYFHDGINREKYFVTFIFRTLVLVG